MALFRALLVLGLAAQLCPSQSHDSLEVYYELQPPKYEYQPPKKYDSQEPSRTYDFHEVFKKDGYEEPSKLYEYQEPPKKDVYQEPLLVSYQEPIDSYQQEPPKVSYQEPSETYDNQGPHEDLEYQEPPKTSYEEPSKAYDYQEPSKTFSYQEPSKKLDYQDPLVVSHQKPPKASYQQPLKKDVYQEPLKSSSEESSKEYHYQEPSKTFDYQEPHKKVDYQKPSKTYDYQEPHKKNDYQEPSVAYSYEEPSKTFVHQKSTKSEYQKSLGYKDEEASYDSREHDSAYLATLATNIPGGGVPGRDYPILASVPYTGFSCAGLEYPGHYADYRARCQVYHVCEKDGRHSSFLCPNGTVFSQWYSVCDWWYNVECDGTQTWFVYTRNGIILAKDADSSRPGLLRKKSDSGSISKGLVVSRDYVPPVESSEGSYSGEEYGKKSLPTPKIYEVPLISHRLAPKLGHTEIGYKQSTSTIKEHYETKAAEQPSAYVTKSNIKPTGDYETPTQTTVVRFSSKPSGDYAHGESSEDSYETGARGTLLGTSQEAYTSEPHVNNFARRVVISLRNKADRKRPTNRYVTDVDASEYDVATTDVSHIRPGHVKPLFRDSVRRFETKRNTRVEVSGRPVVERSLITLYRDPQ
ncbi:uncharacterized protein LOC122243360 [Penaeus japonicus]|uniref:uncharacterized protein LOC122243360 n=1 Tax=Penaeus japonicus TaxID=27405 RepID=UPI001C71586A|nr:uncharacterized protein LOC122243360 [Penaeus japonicus]